MSKVSGIKWTWFNDSNFEHFLKGSAIDGELERAGRKIIANARAIAPVKTGDFRDRFKSEIRQSDDGKRDILVIWNESDHASRTEARYHTLATARDMTSI